MLLSRIVLPFHLLAFVAYAANVLQYTPQDLSSDARILSLFDKWANLHSKSYANNEEKSVRFRVFRDNLLYIHRHNSHGNSSFQLGLNAFSDLTNEEFKLRLGMNGGLPLLNQKISTNDVVIEDYYADVPDSLDWRESGAVIPAKDQGSCGDCWAFSATGAIEGINKIVTGTLVSLSEQELLDCDTSYNKGCSGGLMDPAFQWVIKNGGIDTEDDYPYVQAQRTCNRAKANRRVVTIDDYADVPDNNEKALLQAVAHQPVSVGISGSGKAFQLYSGGIFDGPCSKSLDHAALIVGYGSKDGVDYWILKNSWGRRWGMNGFAYMIRNKGDREGICGINTLASYPIKKGLNPPSPPSPSPAKCDALRYCPAGSTCCCRMKILQFCLYWGCCPLQSAVCCKDKKSCCPQDHPICQLETGKCLKASMNTTKETVGTFTGYSAL